MSALQEVGVAVQQRRTVLGLSQQELAELSGVSTRTVHVLEHGKSTMQVDVLLAVLNAVGLTLRLVPGTNPVLVDPSARHLLADTSTLPETTGSTAVSAPTAQTPTAEVQP